MWLVPPESFCVMRIVAHFNTFCCVELQTEVRQKFKSVFIGRNNETLPSLNIADSL